MRQTALASASGLVAGVAITAVLAENYPHDTFHDLVVPLLARIAPLVCLTLISLCAAPLDAVLRCRHAPPGRDRSPRGGGDPFHRRRLRGANQS